jgi:hypothetical protein
MIHPGAEQSSAFGAEIGSITARSSFVGLNFPIVSRPAIQEEEVLIVNYLARVSSLHSIWKVIEVSAPH